MEAGAFVTSTLAQRTQISARVLSRIIKFGPPGSPMAGHEYLKDAEIVGLARYIQTLHKTGGSATPAAIQP